MIPHGAPSQAKSIPKKKTFIGAAAAAGLAGWLGQLSQSCLGTEEKGCLNFSLSLSTSIFCSLIILEKAKKKEKESAMESARWQGQIGWNALLATARTGFVLLRCALLTFQFPKRKAKLKRCSCLIHIWNNRADWLLLSIRGPVFKLQLYTLLCRTHIKARPPPDPFDLNSFFLFYLIFVMNLS